MNLEPALTPYALLPLLTLALLPEPELDRLTESATTRFLHDPCGIYELAVTQTNDMGALGQTTIAASATARLEGDRWTLLSHRLDDPGNGNNMVSTGVAGQTVPFVLPLLGAFQGEEGGGVASEGRALLDEAVRVARSEVGADTAGVEVYEGREHYRLDMLLGGGWSLWRGREDNTAAVVIDPDSGRAREWRLAVHDPTKLAIGRLVFLDATLRVDPAGQPLAETLHTRARLGPFGLRVERAVTYTRSAGCAAEG